MQSLRHITFIRGSYIAPETYEANFGQRVIGWVSLAHGVLTAYFLPYDGPRVEVYRKVYAARTLPAFPTVPERNEQLAEIERRLFRAFDLEARQFYAREGMYDV